MAAAKGVLLAERSRSLEDFWRTTNQFQTDRPLLANTLEAMTRYLLEELLELWEVLLINANFSKWEDWHRFVGGLDELSLNDDQISQEIIDLEGVISEVGDVGHILNDLAMMLDFKPTEKVWVNGHTPQSVAEFRHRSDELVEEMSGVVPDFLDQSGEIDQYSEIDQYLASFETLLHKFLLALEFGGLMGKAEAAFLLNTILIAYFDLTKKLKLNMVAVVLYKNRRNNQKYRLYLFDQQAVDSGLTYVEAREKSRLEWGSKEELALFMAWVATFGLKSFFLEDDPVLH